MVILSDELTNWTEERAKAVMEQRRAQAITGAGTICVPNKTTRPYFPFVTSGYPYVARIGSLTDPPWTDILSVPASSLVPVDPFSPSQYRHNGLQIWDAAVGIPESVIRAPKVLKTRAVPGVRNTNTYWTQTLIPALGRVGPLGPNGEMIRPKGPYILDLMYDPLGWRMLEGAHALAHRVSETKPRSRKDIVYHPGRVHYQTQQFLFQMAVCRMYGLPIDVWCLDAGRKGEPDVVQYGIEIKASTYFRAPILKVPVLTEEAPRVDETVAFISGGVYIEPHPYAFNIESEAWKEVNRWACSPTIIVVAGWELVDVVTHQTICSTIPEDNRDPICYGMSPVDLQSPDTFWAYLWYAVQHKGLPVVDNKRYWYVEDWLKSQDYENAVSEAPPLPCYDCLRLNMRADGAPQRPAGKAPEPRTVDELALIEANKLRVPQSEIVWIEWDNQLRKIMGLIEKATAYYEGRIYGHLPAAKRRRKCLAGYRRRLRELGEIRSLTRAIDKARRDGVPSRIPGLQKQREALVIAANERMKGTCQTHEQA